MGALLAYPIGDKYGRRIGIVLACGIFSIGVALQTASTTLPLFVAGRVFAGLGVGVTSCLVPMYQSECAPLSVPFFFSSLFLSPSSLTPQTQK